MELSGINTNFVDTAASNAQAATSKAKSAVGKDYSKATDEEMLDACKQFESYFIEQVLKEVEKTIPKNDSLDTSTSNLVDYFKGNVIQEMAEGLQEKSGSRGLAQQMFEQMKRNYGSRVTAEEIDSTSAVEAVSTENEEVLSTESEEA